MSDELNIVSEQSNPLDGAAFAAGPGQMLVMASARNCARLSLRTAQENLKKATKGFGQDIPAQIGEMSSRAGKTALCLGPDEWLLLAPESERESITARFAKQSEQATHSLVDVSHRSVGIDISGPAAALVLNAGCPVDLNALPVGGCTRTIMGKAEIILMKTESEHYRMEVMRSFAGYVWSFLSRAARDFDVESR